MQLQIQKLSRDSAHFYMLLGPLMGSRKVEKEVGIRIYDDADKEWYSAWLGGAFIGVASVRGSVVSDCYVKPAHRYKGALTAMLASIIKYHPGKLRATCTTMSAGVFAQAGFKLIKQTKNFYIMELANA